MKRTRHLRISVLLLIFALVFTTIPAISFAGNTTGGEITFHFANSSSGTYEYKIAETTENNQYSVIIPDWITATTVYTYFSNADSCKMQYKQRKNGVLGTEKNVTCQRGEKYIGNPTKNLQKAIETQGDSALAGNTVTATAKKGEQEYKYEFHIKRQITLKNLSLAGISDYSFDAKETSKEVFVPTSLEKMVIKPEQRGYTHSGTVKINGQEMTGDSYEVTLSSLHWQTENNLDKSKIEIELIPAAAYSDAVKSVYTLNLLRASATGEIAILTQPQDAEYFDNETATPLSVTAIDQSGNLTYQWYKANKSDLSDASPLDDANASTYTPKITTVNEAQISYYFCKIKSAGETHNATSTAAKVKVKKSPYPNIVLSTSDGKTLPSNGFELKVGEAVTDSVKATASAPQGYEGGSYSYRWFPVDEEGNELQILTPFSITDTLALSKTNTDDKISRYVCEVTYTYEGKKFIRRSEAFQVLSYGATEPEIRDNVSSKTAYDIYVGNDITLAFYVMSTLKGELYYQWYHSSDNQTFEPINEERILLDQRNASDSAHFTTDVKTSEGVDYYQCRIYHVIPNSVKDGNLYESVATRTVTVTTKKPEALEGVSGTGTKEKPFQLKTGANFMTLKTAVENGATYYGSYFELVDNVTLPENWTPIGSVSGTAIDKKKIETVFSGNLDGKNHTITIPKGKKSLLNCARNTSISNLNILGEEINGYGLVDNYVVDRQIEKTIDITNVTIKSGTKILESGFIGGYASGESVVNIVSCKIEKGVTIGYTKDRSHIGGFAGEFNGTIINCVSEADVYGVDYVGGIVANKGQSMGFFDVLNCSFDGTVNASGNHVGGICGSGYAGTNFGKEEKDRLNSAPNTGCVTIKNCRSNGKISGRHNVGGILGSEATIMQCWENRIGYIQDNLFTGEINADGANAGGIVGYFRSLNKYTNVNNNYYVKKNEEKGIGGVKSVDTNKKTSNSGEDVVYFNTETCVGSADVHQLAKKVGLEGLERAKHNREDDPLGADADKLCKAVTESELKNGTVMKLLNASTTSFKNWEQRENSPTHSKTPVLYAIELSGTYKTTFKTGDTFSTEGMVITGKLSDGSTCKIRLDDKNLKFSGFDSNKRAVQTITVTYGVAKTTYDVTVLYKESQVKEIVAYFSLLGDSYHKEATADGGPHTLSKGNLQTWVSRTKVTINNNTTVYDVFKKVLNDNGITWKESSKRGTVYIESLTRNGVTLGEYDNGSLSGWMYTLNGTHPDLGVAQQFLNNGDEIIFHYTDDYTKEEGSEKWNTPGADEVKNVTTSGAAGSATTTAPTEVKVSGTTATATIKAENQSEILKQAAEKKSTEIILEVSKADSKGADSVQLSLDVTFVKNVADKTNADLTVNTENGKVTLDQETIKTVLAEAKGATITLEVSKVSKPTEAQKKAAGANGHLLKLTIKSGDKVISDFNKGKVKVVAEIVSKLLDKKVAAIHIADDGKIEQLAGKVLTIGGKKYYEFTTPHFSTFALVDADELGLEVKEEPAVDVKTLTAKLTPVARSAKTAKKNVKVTTSLDKQDKAIVQELKDAGYTVKYRFYRSTKKAAGYKAAVTKKTASYTNTGGKKGTKYFYKVQVRVYDENGKLTAKTALKQCKYASRTWTKGK